MKIEVKNFGPIKKGQIDLDKKVTVFVGYNNSGKTYMSQLLWNLNQQNNIHTFDVMDYYREDLIKGHSSSVLSQIIKNKDAITINNDTTSELSRVYERYVTEEMLPDLFGVSKYYFSNNAFQIDFTGDLFETVKKVSFKYLTYIMEKDYQKDVTEWHLLKKDTESSEVFFEIIKSENHVNPTKYLDGLSDFEFIDMYKLVSTDEGIQSRYDYIKARGVFKILFRILFYQDCLPFFLPANRVFFPSFYKYIYSIAKEEKDLIDDRLKRSNDIESIRALSKSPYTKAVDDLTEKVYDLNKGVKPSNHYEDLVADLKEIIGGDIIIKSAEGIAPIEFYLKLEDEKELEMYMSSSSVNQLTTLYLYLQYWAEKENNFLIIDEPEENLHPENQIKLVNLLMKFADRNNNKVLITTHSPLFADLVNNYANLSSLNEAGIDTDSLIKESNVEMASVKSLKQADYGIYFFNGDSIKEYEINDYGAYFRDFQTAENKVKDMSDILKGEIYNNINENARKSFQKK